jgi:imidazolonepropionase-like amidohydrolase
LEFELMSESIKTCLAVFLLSLFQAAAESQQAAPDLVLLNGKIFTSDAAHPYVQALAIRGERITATGDTAKIRAMAGHHTKQIDLGGRTVIPGINDAHAGIIGSDNTLRPHFDGAATRHRLSRIDEGRR